MVENELGFVIFGCTNDTMNECLSKNLLGTFKPKHIYISTENFTAEEKKLAENLLKLYRGYIKYNW